MGSKVYTLRLSNHLISSRAFKDAPRPVTQPSLQASDYTDKCERIDYVR